MSRGRQPLAQLNCPGCKDHGKVSWLRARTAPRFAPEVHGLVDALRDGLGTNMPSRLDELLRARGLQPESVLGRVHSGGSYAGWARFVDDGGDVYLLVLLVERARKNEDWASAVLIDRRGWIADRVNAVCDSRRGSLQVGFGDAAGAVMWGYPEERDVEFEVRLLHAEGLPMTQISRGRWKCRLPAGNGKLIVQGF